MITFGANSKCEEAEVSIKVFRADGRVDDYGVVAYHNSNKIKQLIWNIKNWIKNHIKGD